MNSLLQQRDREFLVRCKEYADRHKGRCSLSDIASAVAQNTPARYYVDFEHALIVCRRYHRLYSALPDEAIPAVTLRQRMWAEIYVKSRRFIAQHPYRNLRYALSQVLTGRSSSFFISRTTAMRLLRRAGFTSACQFITTVKTNKKIAS